MDWLDLLAVQGTLKSLLQHHSSKASVLRCSVFFVVHGSAPELALCQTRGRWWERGWGILLLAHSGLPHPSHPSLPTPKHTHTHTLVQPLPCFRWGVHLQPQRPPCHPPQESLKRHDNKMSCNVLGGILTIKRT